MKYIVLVHILYCSIFIRSISALPHCADVPKRESSGHDEYVRPTDVNIPSTICQHGIPWINELPSAHNPHLPEFANSFFPVDSHDIQNRLEMFNLAVPEFNNSVNRTWIDEFPPAPNVANLDISKPVFNNSVDRTLRIEEFPPAPNVANLDISKPVFNNSVDRTLRIEEFPPAPNVANLDISKPVFNNSADRTLRIEEFPPVPNMANLDISKPVFNNSADQTLRIEEFPPAPNLPNSVMPQSNNSYFPVLSHDIPNRMEMLNPTFPRLQQPAIWQGKDKDEFVTCSVGTLKFSEKSICKGTCEKAQGYFPNDDDHFEEFICFHSDRKVQRISYDGRAYECGVKMNKYTKLKTYLPCVPKLKFKISDRIPCDRYIGFVFHTWPKKTVVRCELKNFQVKLHSKLDVKMGGRIARTTIGGSKKGDYPCDCGITRKRYLLDRERVLRKAYEHTNSTTRNKKTAYVRSGGDFKERDEDTNAIRINEYGISPDSDDRNIVENATSTTNKNQLLLAGNPSNDGNSNIKLTSEEQIARDDSAEESTNSNSPQLMDLFFEPVEDIYMPSIVFRSGESSREKFSNNNYWYSLPDFHDFSSSEMAGCSTPRLPFEFLGDLPSKKKLKSSFIDFL